MNQETAFLEAIRAEPGEDVHRLAYADWLSERDDPRGEFIRVQCRLARLGEGEEERARLVEREAELLRLHQVEWTDGAFVRWLKHPKKACRNPEGHPFCRYMAKGVAARCEMDRLAEDDPERERLRKAIEKCGQGLEEYCSYYADTCTAPLFDAVTFRRGFIEAATVQDYTLHLFSEAVFELSMLRDLVVDEEEITDLGDKVIRGLLRGIGRTRLEQLDIVTVADTVKAIEELAASPHVANLYNLDLFLPAEGDAAMKALAASPYLSKLERLAVSCQGSMGDEGLRAVLESPHLSGLTELTFDCEEPRFGAEMRRRYEERFGKR